MRLASMLSMPWAPDRSLYCSPGRLVLRLPIGVTPPDIPTIRDVRTGNRKPAQRIDDGAIDRVLSRFSSGVKITRLHGAAASRHQAGRRNVGYNDHELAFGLADTLRLNLDRNTPITDVIDALRQLSTVAAVGPHYLCAQGASTPAAAGPDAKTSWVARDLIRAGEALRQEPGDDALIVAIVDTGVAGDHPELEGKLRPGFDTVQLGAVDLATGLRLLGDLTKEDMEPLDEVGHGTACAAIIGARGKTLPPGCAGAARLLALRVLGSAALPGKNAPIGVGAIADIDDGLKRAIDLGARVLNLSFGTPIDALDPNDPVPHVDVVRYGAARGCIMVAASGNSGKAERYSPACLDEVIAVGAVTDGGEPADFTTTGDHVAVSAPGLQVPSAGLTGTTTFTGTSFAAPFVTAAAALLVGRANRHATPLGVTEARRLLMESARPFRSATQGCGAGVLDMAAAVAHLDASLSDEPAASSSRRL
jgi:subtilisin family serine protease